MEIFFGIVLAVYLTGVAAWAIDGLLGYLAARDIIQIHEDISSANDRVSGWYKKMKDSYIKEKEESVRQIRRSPLWPIDLAILVRNALRNR